MAIKKSFSGQSIRKPGAYSKSQISPDAGTDLAANETVLIIGEADAGEGGATAGIVSLAASAFSTAKATYRGGPLMDCAKAALVPTRTPNIGGAGRILFYKTNASTQAELALANSYDTITAEEYGVGGNRIVYKNTLSAETPPSVTGSAAVTNFAGLDGLTLELRANGGASETVTFATPANIADVISQIEAQTTDLSASEASAVLSIEKDSIANGHRNGWGQTIEVVGGTALTLLFLTAGQFGTATEQTATVNLKQPRDLVETTTVIGGTVTLTIGRDNSGSATAATVAVSSTAVDLTAAGAGEAFTFLKTDYPLIGNLVDAINAKTGWTATALATDKLKPIGILDEISATGAFSEAGNSPARIKTDAQAWSDLMDTSNLVDGEATPPAKGLPDAEGPTNLAGGTRGASSTSSFDAGLTAALAEETTNILMAVSQDAADDITAGFTDAASTYDVESVHSALVTHLLLRGDVKNRREAQGWVGYRKAAKADVYQQAASIGSSVVQLAMQDVLVNDVVTAELTWKQPHVMAALMCGLRLGTEVGEPLTHKYVNASGVGHYVNTSTGKSAGDFNPLVDYDDAIDAGVTFTEPKSGANRIVVDNTTYGTDGNFVFNRGSVVEASQYIARTVRDDAELAFVGKKNAIVDATSIKSRVRTKLKELFEAKITSASDDGAPEGYKEETFVVTVQGNTAQVFVEVKPVQGLDFILITFTLGDTTQSA